MSKTGNAFLRAVAYRMAVVGVQHNPIIRADYDELPLSHCMSKALAIVWAVWRGGRDFDPAHGSPDSARREPMGSSKRAKESAFWAALHHIEPGLARRTWAQLLERFGLEERASEPVKRLSRGMKQRLHLARGSSHTSSCASR